MRRFLIASTVLGACAAVLLLVGSGARFHVASADDATHATSFALGPGEYDEDFGVLPSILATITSTDAADVSVHIRMYWTDPSYGERLASEGTADRSGSGSLSITCRAPQAEFSGNTSMRAVFEAKDASGQITFSYQRTLTVP